MQTPLPQPSFLETLATIGSILTPILVIILSAIVARSSRVQEKIQALQMKLQDDRIEIYNAVLEPYIILATPDALLIETRKI